MKNVIVRWVLGTIFELGSSRMPLEGGSVLNRLVWLNVNLRVG
jgi:hypothetical protein